MSAWRISNVKYLQISTSSQEHRRQEHRNNTLQRRASCKETIEEKIAEKCCKSTERFSSTFCNKRLNKHRTYCALELFIVVLVCRNKRKNNVFVLIAAMVFLSHESTFLVSMEYNKIASMMIPQEFTQLSVSLNHKI